mmetsp:Transcript_30556/g.37205  ORF Transcript_30556/g.37205 Transcript_30556/m.37205 type:complete len:96 (-) Transcript_30556:845-1132(-)
MPPPPTHQLPAGMETSRYPPELEPGRCPHITIPQHLPGAVLFEFHDAVPDRGELSECRETVRGAGGSQCGLDHGAVEHAGVFGDVVGGTGASGGV